MLVSASARAHHVNAQLAETLRTMATDVLADASLTVPLDGRRLDAAGIVADPELARTIERVAATIEDAARRYRSARRPVRASAPTAAFWDPNTTS